MKTERMAWFGFQSRPVVSQRNILAIKEHRIEQWVKGPWKEDRCQDSDWSLVPPEWTTVSTLVPAHNVQCGLFLQRKL